MGGEERRERRKGEGEGEGKRGELWRTHLPYVCCVASATSTATACNSLSSQSEEGEWSCVFSLEEREWLHRCMYLSSHFMPFYCEHMLESTCCRVLVPIVMFASSIIAATQRNEFLSSSIIHSTRSLHSTPLHNHRISKINR